MSQSLDPLLWPLLEATDEMAIEAELERLLREHVEPVIRRVLAHRFGRLPAEASSPEGASWGEDAEDVRQDALYQVIRQLHRLKECPREHAIADLRAYVASVAVHAFDTYLQTTHPLWHRLKNRIRRLVRRRSHLFACWEERGERLIGFAAWRREGKPLRRTEAYARLLYDPVRTLPPEKIPSPMREEEVLTLLLDHVGGPIELDDAVCIIARLWNLQDGLLSLDAMGEALEEDSLADLLPDPSPSPEETFLLREWLQRLWREIRQLPLHQRIAFLLHTAYRKGKRERKISILEILWRRETASMRELAQALDMTEQELTVLWNQLPLKAEVIAERLQVTPEQVLGFLSSARRRLARRLFGEEFP